MATGTRTNMMKSTPARDRRRGRPRLLSLAVGLALLVAALGVSRPAWAIVGDTMGLFGVDGSIRMINAGLVNPPVKVPKDLEPLVDPLLPDDGDGMSQLLFRLTVGGWPTDWLSYEAHLVQAVSISTAEAGGTSVLETASSETLYRAVDARWDWAEEPGMNASLGADRLNLSFALPFADVIIGRQAISFGKAYFWNPLDVFLAFDPFQFDRDYKPGVDALRLEVPIGDFAGLTVVGALSNVSEDEVWGQSAALIRLWGMLWDTDFAIQGGSVADGYHVGGAAIGELGPLEVRGEAAYFHPREQDDSSAAAGGLGGTPTSATASALGIDRPAAVTAVAGLGRRFENSLYVSAEYLYNGIGREDAASRWALVTEGHAQHVTEHVAGVMASYELSPLITVSMASVVAIDPDSPSVLIQPGLVYSAADEVEILAGAMLAFGERPGFSSGSGGLGGLASLSTSSLLPSEFGAYPHVFYLEMKAYF